MKKFIAIIMAVVMCASLCSCSIFNADKKEVDNAIDNVVDNINAGELDLAISIISEMDEKTLSSGKSEILEAIISEMETYIDPNAWVCTDNCFVDEDVIVAFEKYQTIVNALDLSEDESNVNAFIEKVLSLKEYIRWNDLHVLGKHDYENRVIDMLKKGLNNSTYAKSYYQEAYNLCMEAYNNCKNYTGYGIKEASDYYYDYASTIYGFIYPSYGTTSNDDDASREAYTKIIQEEIEDMNVVIDICDSFPESLY